ncbi:monovalent cation/H+ antiporter subunit D [Aromatoleum sp.]|uniref:monovalent cation/H+ antiporter subunit D n=1 Tax=Aromatoleum sp. TaxID=2307007 RepID=UPI002FCC719D
MTHWTILPILLPAAVASLLALAGRRDLVLARAASLASAVVLLLVAIGLAAAASDGTIRTYALGDWPAPFGIVLVVDRLSALMLTLTAALALAVLLHCANGWDARGRHFHALFQFQLMGLNGAFLTGDFFNLFVFFEILLIASYGLMVHGGGAARVRAGLQYVVVNLVGSTLFLFAVGLLYGVTGTLNMADLALKVPAVPPADQGLLRSGALLLLFVFALKAALVPLHLWLPGTYSNAPAPVAALFAVLTKVGAYAIIRLSTLAFGDTAGDLAWLAAPWLMPAAMLTLTLGMVGVLAARRLAVMISFAVVGSVGTLLIAVALFTQQAIAAALYYLVQSTLAAGAFFLVADLVGERRAKGDLLAAGPRIAQAGLIGALFLLAAIAMTGLPPLSGFVGKLLILDATRDAFNRNWIWSLLLSTSLLAIVGFARAGSVLFWKGGVIGEKVGAQPPRRTVLPVAAVGLLLAANVALTVGAGPVVRYLDAAATQLFAPAAYIDAVLGAEGENE